MDDCESESDPTLISKIRVVGFNTVKWQVVPVKEVVNAFAYQKNMEIKKFRSFNQHYVIVHWALETKYFQMHQKVCKTSRVKVSSQPLLNSPGVLELTVRN